MEGMLARRRKNQNNSGEQAFIEMHVATPCSTVTEVVLLSNQPSTFSSRCDGYTDDYDSLESVPLPQGLLQSGVVFGEALPSPSTPSSASVQVMVIQMGVTRGNCNIISRKIHMIFRARTQIKNPKKGL